MEEARVWSQKLAKEGKGVGCRGQRWTEGQGK